MPTAVPRYLVCVLWEALWAWCSITVLCPHTLCHHTAQPTQTDSWHRSFINTQALGWELSEVKMWQHTPESGVEATTVAHWHVVTHVKVSAVAFGLCSQTGDCFTRWPEPQPQHCSRSLQEDLGLLLHCLQKPLKPQLATLEVWCSPHKWSHRPNHRTYYICSATTINFKPTAHTDLYANTLQWPLVNTNFWAWDFLNSSCTLNWWMVTSIFIPSGIFHNKERDIVSHGRCYVIIHHFIS